MEWVNHINVHQVSCCGFICQVYRVFQRQVPYRECFKFCIACKAAAFVFVIYLGQTYSQFATAWTRCCDNYQRFCCFNKIIFAVTFITYNCFYIAWIVWDRVMLVAFDTQIAQFCNKVICGRLMVISCKHNAIYRNTHFLEFICKTQDIHIVRNTQVSAYLCFFYVICRNAENNFCIVAQCLKQFDFCIRFKARQNSGRVEIVKQFATKFQVKLTVKLIYTFFDFAGLFFYIQFVAESFFKHLMLLRFK